MKQKIILLALMLLILLTVYADNYTTIVIVNVPVSADSCTPTYNQNWIISDECIKVSENINLGSGRLHIQNDGNLTLVNASVLIDSNISCQYKANTKCVIFGSDSNFNVHE